MMNTDETPKIKDLEFGQRCYFARKVFARTVQEKVAEAAGISQSMYSRYEKGLLARENRNGLTVQLIAETCGVDPVWLDYGRNEFAPEGYQQEEAAA